MSYDLPEFDKLREMAQHNPEELERLRVRLCDQLIQDAPEKHRRNFDRKRSLITIHSKRSLRD